MASCPAGSLRERRKVSLIAVECTAEQCDQREQDVAEGNESADDDDESSDESKAGIIKRSWTTEEDQMLLDLVSQHGPRRWSVIASHLDQRVGKQCRERWHNHLSPAVKKDSWSEEEDKIIMDNVEKIGTKWSKIVKLLPGRTDNSIKNRWNSTMRKNIRKQIKLAEQANSAPPVISKKAHQPACSRLGSPAKLLKTQLEVKVQLDAARPSPSRPSPSRRGKRVSNEDLDTAVLTHLTGSKKTVQLAKEIAMSEHLSDSDKKQMLRDLILREIEPSPGSISFLNGSPTDISPPKSSLADCHHWQWEADLAECRIHKGLTAGPEEEQPETSTRDVDDFEVCLKVEPNDDDDDDNDDDQGCNWLTFSTDPWS